MNKMIKFFLIMTVIVSLNTVYGQQNKEVAVLQPRVIGKGEVSTNDKLIISSSMKKAFTQVDGYEAYSRTSQSLIAAEQAFQLSGAVDDRQIKEIGRQTGVAYICVFTLSKEKNELVVNSEIINVVTGKIDNSDFIVLLNVNDRENVTKQCQELAYNLLGVSHTSGVNTIKKTSSSGTKRNGEIWNPDGIEMVYVEGKGSGIMATPGFYIGKFEVTQEQWQAIMGSNPSNFKGSNLPVENVSWNDVQEFINKLNARTGRNYRLPTEAEWEYAARGGNLTKGYEYSGSNSVNDVAWYTENSGSSTKTVGTKKPNELGIYDMSGNVWEWCQDWYDSSNQYRVIRGGSWNRGAAYGRVSYRHDTTPSYRSNNLGFRLAFSSE
ncbi:MAG: SUMF1/EgtB/PvdO family nonheme iron enzyme [Marinilabiliaceae bacterium]|nr:SUMF1/EgtB/PvdO family nonheme iron enzyme [Marinilabiliaceae bacterium]